MLLLAACGGGAAPTSAGTSNATPGGGATSSAPAAAATAKGDTPARTVDACALISAADLKSATGRDFGSGILEYGQCIWVSTDTRAQDYPMVVLFTGGPPLAMVKASFPGGADATVRGKAAYWNPTEGLQSIWVDVGGRTLVLSFPKSSGLGPNDKAIAQKLAEIAVSKM
jgi:hypothetical protein